MPLRIKPGRAGETRDFIGNNFSYGDSCRICRQQSAISTGITSGMLSARRDIGQYSAAPDATFCF